jgi:HSP20 family protein
MAEMRRRMDSLFSQVFGTTAMPTAFGGFPDWYPSRIDEGMEPDVDVYDNENEYIVHAALPGCRPEDINLQATGSSVMLSCEYRSPFREDQEGAQTGDQKKEPTPLRQSRYSSAGRYEFSYQLPDEVDPNRISAEFKNGRLEIRVPKIEQPGYGKPIHVPIREASSGQGNLTGGAEGSVSEPFVPAGGGQAEKRAAHETKLETGKGKTSRGKAANPSPS